VIYKNNKAIISCHGFIMPFS